MKKIVLFLLFSNIFVCHAQYTSIPDVYFEQELINQGYDFEIDGQVLTSNVDSIVELDLNSVNSQMITTLFGIENFIALESLVFKTALSLQNLNLNQNLNLKSIILFNGFVTNINFSKNLLLETIELQNMPLTQLNISQNVNLKRLIIIDFLEINTLNINNNTAIEFLYLSNLPLTTIDLTYNLNLKTFYATFTPLNTIDITQNYNLTDLGLGINSINTIDLTNNVNLKTLYLNYNPISDIDLTNNINLEDLALAFNTLSNIDTSQNLLLKRFAFGNNFVTNINVSNNVLLEDFSCSNVNLNELNFNNNPLINKFKCTNCNLSSLSLKNGGNQLLNGSYEFNTFIYNRFDVTNNPNLNCIFVDDVSNCSANWLGVDSNSHFVSSQEDCNNLNMETFISKNESTLFPNPTDDILNIKVPSSIQEISIYDLVSKIVLYQKGNLRFIDVSNLSKGMYIVNVQTANDKFKMKFIKK